MTKALIDAMVSIQNAAGMTNNSVCQQKSLNSEDSEYSAEFEAIETPLGGQLLLDGTSEVNDVLLASCFAMRDNLMLEKLSDVKYQRKEDIPATETLENICPEALSYAGEPSIKSESDPSDDKDQSDQHHETTSGSSSEEETDDFNISHDSITLPLNDLDPDTPSLSIPENSVCAGLQSCTGPETPRKISDSAQVSGVATITSVVGNLLIMKAKKDCPPLDVGSVVCSESRDVLGTISDTFGPIHSPFHAVCIEERFRKKEYTVGETVYADLTTSKFLFNEEKLPLSFLYEKFENESASSNESEAENTSHQVSVKRKVEPNAPIQAKKSKERQKRFHSKVHMPNGAFIKTEIQSVAKLPKNIQRYLPRNLVSREHQNNHSSNSFKPRRNLIEAQNYRSCRTVEAAPPVDCFHTESHVLTPWSRNNSYSWLHREEHNLPKPEAYNSNPGSRFLSTGYSNYQRENYNFQHEHSQPFHGNCRQVDHRLYCSPWPYDNVQNESYNIRQDNNNFEARYRYVNEAQCAFPPSGSHTLPKQSFVSSKNMTRQSMQTTQHLKSYDRQQPSPAQNQDFILDTRTNSLKDPYTH